MAKKITDENGKVYYEKKPFFKRTWFIILAVVLIIIIMSNVLGHGKSDNSSNSSSQSVNTDSNSEAKKITYSSVDASTMLENLNSNALKAEKTYKDKYVEVTGKVYNIDSSGKYINIDGVNDQFTITGIMCSLKTDKQRDVVAELTKGQTVVVKGKVTSVGEVLGYSLDVDEIIAK